MSKSLVSQLYEIQKQKWALEVKLYEEIDSLFQKFEKWPFEQYVFSNNYHIIHFCKCSDTFEIKGDKLNRLWELGFASVKLDYQSGITKSIKYS